MSFCCRINKGHEWKFSTSQKFLGIFFLNFVDCSEFAICSDFLQKNKSDPFFRLVFVRRIQNSREDSKTPELSTQRRSVSCRGREVRRRERKKRVSKLDRKLDCGQV